jgi:hypothetical protein
MLLGGVFAFSGSGGAVFDVIIALVLGIGGLILLGMAEGLRLLAQRNENGRREGKSEQTVGAVAKSDGVTRTDVRRMRESGMRDTPPREAQKETGAIRDAPVGPQVQTPERMTWCTLCGKEVRLSDAFCPKCGTRNLHHSEPAPDES